MKRVNLKNACLTAAAGAVIGLASVASADPTVIHISGATLLENYLNRRAATNDFIDADGDKNARSIPNVVTIDQLAPFEIPGGSGASATWGANTYWGVLYSATSSGTGLQELIDQGRSFNTGNSTATTMPKSARSSAYFNRYKYIVGGAGFDDAGSEFPGSIGQIMNDGNAGGVPVRSITGAGVDQFKALFTVAPTASTQPNDGLTVDGGVTVDIAILDVPVRYAVTQSGAGSPERHPLQAGYGNNQRVPANPNGTAAAGNHRLASLAPRTGAPSFGVNANLNAPASADANTLFDTPLFFAPIAPIVNFGTGYSQVKMTELRYLYGSGRMPTGENLVVVTRNSTSGTRNGWQNAIGQDPSYGVGDNIGATNNSIVNDRLGGSFLADLKNGNPRVEQTVFNHRLSIGYVGPERGISNGSSDVQWLTQGYCDVPSVMNDLPNYGGTTYVRPTLTNILNNNTPATAWVIGGPAALATFGDPASNAPEVGGLGWMEPYQDTNANNVFDAGIDPFNDLNGNSVRDAVEARPGVLPPAMRNAQAAAFINNITRSITAFSTVPGGDDTLFTPGEYAATQFILNGALPRQQELTNPTNLIANPSFNASLQSFILSSTNVMNNAAFTSFGSQVGAGNPQGNSRAGKVPARADGTYSDAAVNANAATGVYITEGGASLNGRSGSIDNTRDNLPLRNLIAGDFSGDGLRNVNDAADLVGAWKKRNGVPGWVAPNGSGALQTLATSLGQSVPGADLSIEILGDFNGDGTFNAADVRYFADGLAIATSGANAGKLDRLAGFKAVDTAFGGSLNFFGTINGPGVSGIKAYAIGDSAADVAGAVGVTRGAAPVGADGRVDAKDIDYVFAQFNQAGIDGTEVDWAAEYDETALADLSADVTGDLKINQADAAYVVNTVLCTNFGDLNLDGRVNSADVAIIGTPSGAAGTWVTGDVDGNGIVNGADLAIVNANVGKPRPCCPTDFNFDGTTSADDIFAFLDQWFAQNGTAGSADFNNSGGVTADDIFAFLDAWFAGNGVSCP